VHGGKVILQEVASDIEGKARIALDESHWDDFREASLSVKAVLT
jgi:hypothetical protein